jgi:hypothetical protein
MKSVSVRFCTFAAALAAVAVSCISPVIAHGQSEGLGVTVPFDFYVGSQKLPAGRYAVTHMSDPSVVKIYDGNGHASVSLTNGVYNRVSTNNGQLIFARYGDQYFLSEVRWAGSSLGRQLLKSPLEIQIAKASTPERVVASTNK